MITDHDPQNTGSVVWRDDGAARGRLARVEVHQDRRDADTSAARIRSRTSRRRLPNDPTVRVYRRDLRVDGARAVVYVVVVREPVPPKEAA